MTKITLAILAWSFICLTALTINLKAGVFMAGVGTGWLIMGVEDMR